MKNPTIISIITVNLNNKSGLLKTIISVIGQTFKDFEFIIIDGESDDGSTELLFKFRNQINFQLSEKDDGIYTAMNKGINYATGEYLLFLNSGDYLAAENVLETIIRLIRPGVMVCSGDIKIIEGSTLTIKKNPDELSFGFLAGKALLHQASFINKQLFLKYGLYNEQNKIVSDWEFFILTLGINRESYQKINVCVAEVESLGISCDLKNQPIWEQERRDALQRNLPFLTSTEIDKFIFSINYAATKRMKYLFQIEKRPLIRKVATLLLKLLSWFSGFKNKNGQSLL